MRSANRPKFTRRIAASIVLLGCVAAVVWPLTFASPAMALQAVGNPADCVDSSDCPADKATFLPSPNSCPGVNRGFCFGKPPAVTLSIPIGGVGEISDLGKWVQVVYQFAIGIAAVLAAVMIMIGGIKYMTAGGDAGRVKDAKSGIEDAIIGLILALGAYVILQTVNPDMLQLRTPSVKYVVPSREFDGVDKANRTRTTGKSCTRMSDCVKPDKCVVMDRSGLDKLMKTVAYTSMAAMGGAIVVEFAGGAAATWALVKDVGGTALKLGAKAALQVGKLAIMNTDLVLIAAGSALVVAAAAPDADLVVKDSSQFGICMTEADRSLPNNELCTADGQCQSGLCLSENTFTFGTLGLCTDGKIGSPCKCDGDAKNCTSKYCKEGTCVEKISGTFLNVTGFRCSDGKQFSPCSVNDDCEPGKVCAKQSIGFFGETEIGTCREMLKGKQPRNTSFYSCRQKTDCARRIKVSDGFFSSSVSQTYSCFSYWTSDSNYHELTRDTDTTTNGQCLCVEGSSDACPSVNDRDSCTKNSECYSLNCIDNRCGR